MVAGPYKSQKGKKKKGCFIGKTRRAAYTLDLGRLSEEPEANDGDSQGKSIPGWNCSSRAQGEKYLRGFWNICEVVSELLRLGPGECCQTQGREEPSTSLPGRTLPLDFISKFSNILPPGAGSQLVQSVTLKHSGGRQRAPGDIKGIEDEAEARRQASSEPAERRQARASQGQ